MSETAGTNVAVLFPGQGSQFRGMADPWLDHPAGKDVIERASNVLGWDVVERTRDEDALGRTEVVQPALFAVELAAYAVLQAEGVRFDAAAGHSLGEYSALVASGAVDFDGGLAALAVRADAMGAASRETKGTMTALLGLTPEEAHDVCEVAGRGDVLAVANENAAKQTVLSGSIEAIEKAEAAARTLGARAIRLQVAGAFHSPLMQPALPAVRQAIARIEFKEPAFPIVPNVSAKATTNPLVLRDLLSRQMVSPVRWEATMRTLGEMGMTGFVEAGPGEVLGKLARRAVPGSIVRQVGSPEAAAEAAEAIRRSPRTGEGP